MQYLGAENTRSTGRPTFGTDDSVFCALAVVQRPLAEGSKVIALQMAILSTHIQKSKLINLMMEAWLRMHADAEFGGCEAEESTSVTASV